MKTLKAILLVAVCTITIAAFGQTPQLPDSLKANNYPNTMPYVPKTPDYKNNHMNIHDTAFNNTYKRNQHADSATMPKRITIDEI